MALGSKMSRSARFVVGRLSDFCMVRTTVCSLELKSASSLSASDSSELGREISFVSYQPDPPNQFRIFPSRVLVSPSLTIDQLNTSAMQVSESYVPKRVRSFVLSVAAKLQ